MLSLYKGLYPLWGRQIPYTMMKFASFENIVAAIWNYLPGTKNDYGKGAQTMVAFSGGYLAGILCAIVSHPADVMVSKLNANRGQGEAFGAAMGRIYKDIGFAGLWNGLPVRIVMIVSTSTSCALYAMLINALGHTHRLAMDDLRFIQALRWSAYDWVRTTAERNPETLNYCLKTIDTLLLDKNDAHVLTLVELGIGVQSLTAGCCTIVMARIQTSASPLPDNLGDLQYAKLVLVPIEHVETEHELGKFHCLILPFHQAPRGLLT